jgi:hypothetical protein
MATTLRVSESTRQHAADLARRTGVSIGELVDKALAAYETAEFWEQTQRALAKHADALASDGAWDHSVRDNLDRD